MEKNNKIKSFGMFWLVLSLVFLIPLNMGVAFAEDTATGSGSASSSGASFAQNEDVYSTCGGGGINIKSSLVLSIVALCIPGILEKVNDWKQIKCQTIKCTYESVKNDLDPSYCKKIEGYQVCKYVVGEAFAIPPLSMLEYWRQAAADVFANPVGALWGVAYTGMKKVVTGGCNGATPGILCNVFSNVPLGVAVPVLVITDGAYVVQTLKEIFDNAFEDRGADMCKGLDKIKKEMEQIIEAGTYDPDDGNPGNSSSGNSTSSSSSSSSSSNSSSSGNSSS